MIRLAFLSHFFSILTLFLSCQAAHALIFQPAFAKLSCGQAIQTLIAHWEINPTSSWTRSVAETGEESWRIHGKEFAEWIFVQVKKDHSTELVHFLPDAKIETTQFNQKQCELQKVKSRNAFTKKGKAEDYFTDQDLKKLIESKKNGLLYVWSPHMSLSVPGVEAVQKAAADLGLPITFILDPLANEKDAAALVKLAHLPASAMKRVQSQELTVRAATLHYPALLLYKKGNLCEMVQRGYRDQTEYRKIATGNFGECS